MVNQSLQKRIKSLPRLPGVYLFLGGAGEVLYVGKAVNLRSRVGQYFGGGEGVSRGERIVQLVAQIAQIKIRRTDNALEALVLEANLIKKHQPKYNVLEKDDKSFSYFVVTREEFARVVILRKTDLAKSKYQVPKFTRGKVFGPYTSRAHMVAALRILRKIFPFHSNIAESEKGCLEFQIGLCSGPYAARDAISQEDYQRNIDGIKTVLSGGRKRLLSSLRRQMEVAAKREEFELAAVLRNQIAALAHINDVALLRNDFDSVPNDIGDIDGGEGGGSGENLRKLRVECFDVSHLSGGHAVAAMVVAIGGKLQNDKLRKFVVRGAYGGDDLRAMREVLERRAGHWDDWGVPDVIVIDGGATHLAMAEELWKSLQVTVPLLAVAKGPTRKKVDIYPSHRYPPIAQIISDAKLLEQLREQAHRVAITLHRKRRDKDFLT